jgi:hypothetical protein
MIQSRISFPLNITAEVNGEERKRKREKRKLVVKYYIKTDILMV